MVGETNRAPFDLPEAEGELVGGFHTEYSSLKFALFFLAEYINMVTVSALATTLFLGGWRAPWPISLWSGANTGWWPLLWFFGKVCVFIFVFIWLRGTLPRLRYDQFMKFGWKVLIPVSLRLDPARRDRRGRPAPRRRRPSRGCSSARSSCCVLLLGRCSCSSRRRPDAGATVEEPRPTADDAVDPIAGGASRCRRCPARTAVPPRRRAVAGRPGRRRRPAAERRRTRRASDARSRR